MNEDFIEELLEEALELTSKPSFQLEDFLFKEQLDLAHDPAKFATAVCSVRAGKTIACAADLIYTAINKPGTVGLYITLARSSAKRIVWPELHNINRNYQLQGTPNESDLSFKFPNGSIIYCSGASDAQEIEKFRGLSNVALAYLDECFHSDTPVETSHGSKEISQIKVGDLVRNALGWGQVQSVSVKKHSKYVRLFYGGSVVKCSLNHLFFSSRGWVKAKDLKKGDLLATQKLSMRLLCKDVYKNDVWEFPLSFLQSELLREVSTDIKQSDAQRDCKAKSLQYAQENGTRPTNSQGQRHRRYPGRKSADSLLAKYCMELFSRIRFFAGWVSKKLQARFGLPRIKTRDRWFFSCFFQEKKPRQKERVEVDFIRVDHTQILECTSDPTNSEGLFYDIGVSGHPSFTVGGALVHNCQAFRSHIKELVEEILIKRLYDTNGRLRMIGTPGPIPSGYFHDASKSDKWSHHAWTLHNNPWIEKKSGKTVQELIQQDCDRKGVTLEDASIQRECFGRWVLDSNSLLLEYKPEINDFSLLPQGNWNYILGMDFGFDDADSFSILGWADNSPNTYLVEEVITHKQTYEQMAAQVDDLFKRYKFCKVVADPGGGGKKLIESLKPRYLIPMNTADKQGKIANYGLLNNALRTSRFFARSSSRFAQDCNLLERDVDKSTPDKTVVKGHSDAVDSCLYAFRESPAYGYTHPVAPLKAGSEAWAKDQEEKMREELYRQVKEEQETLKDPWQGYQSEYY